MIAKIPPTFETRTPFPAELMRSVSKLVNNARNEGRASANSRQQGRDVLVVLNL
jgi:hypothetical protein